MHLCSESFSANVKFSSLKMLQMFPVCFYCSDNFMLPQIPLGSDDNHLVFDSFWFSAFGFQQQFSLRDPAMLAVVSSKRIGEKSLVLLFPRAFSLNYISFANSYNNFLSINLAGSILFF